MGLFSKNDILDDVKKELQKEFGWSFEKNSSSTMIMPTEIGTFVAYVENNTFVPGFCINSDISSSRFEGSREKEYLLEILNEINENYNICCSLSLFEDANIDVSFSSIYIPDLMNYRISYKEKVQLACHCVKNVVDVIEVLNDEGYIAKVSEIIV